MADTTVSTLVFQMTYDSEKFDRGITASKRELRDAKRIMQQVKTPTERYRDETEKLGNLLRKGAINLETYNRALDRLKRNMNGTAAATSRAGDGIARQNSNITLLVGRLLPLAAAMKAGRTIVGLTATAETSRTAYRNILGDAEAARDLLEDINQLSTKTPFTPNELRDSGKALLAFNFAADEVVDTLRILGDISAGSGRPLQEFVQILGKVRDRNRVTLETMNEFGLRSASLWGPLQEAMGVTREDLERLISTGNVGFDELLASLRVLTGEGGLYFDQMAKQSETLNGKWSTLTGNIDLFMEKVGDEYLDRMIDFTSAMNELAEVMNEIVGADGSTTAFDWINSAVPLFALQDWYEAIRGWMELDDPIPVKDAEKFKDSTGEIKKNTAEIAEHFKAIKGGFTGARLAGSQGAFKAVIEHRFGASDRTMERRKIELAEDQVEALESINRKMDRAGSFKVVGGF